MKNKKPLCYLLLILLLLLSVGCSEGSVNSSDTVAATEETHVDESEDSDMKMESSSGTESMEESISAQETKRVGQDIYGYVSIPENWVNFINEGAQEDSIQFSDPTGSDIITLSAALNPEQDPKAVLNAVAESMVSEGAEDVTGATVSLNGIDAVQVYGYYASEDIFFIAWAFLSEDGYMHFVSAEGSISTITTVVDYLESTYSLEN